MTEVPFRRRLATFALLALAISFGRPLPVAAHAEPERAEPPIGGVVAAMPSVVAVVFDEELGATGSALAVFGPGPDGPRADRNDAALDLGDLERRRVTVSLSSNLGPGTYTVRWTTVSAADGDEASGEFAFTVAPGATTPASLPASAMASPLAAVFDPTPTSPSVASSAAEVPTDEADDDGGFGAPVATGLLVVGVLAVLGAVWFRGRRTHPSS